MRPADKMSSIEIVDKESVEFECIRRLGAGACGTVFHVKDKFSGDDLALKLVDWLSMSPEMQVASTGTRDFNCKATAR